jgi:2-polyprenyl-3-methyl-5-hydroxy-6-metoxy-1,4-benzoquinol methylase
MDDTTINRLNDINQAFYRMTAASFDRSRAQPWPGWERLLPHLNAPLSVLDVGCGNGRLGVFLAERLAGQIVYCGLDSSPELLERAEAALCGLDNVQVRLDVHDIIAQPPDEGEYDLVALFGVIHHVSGVEHRRAVMRTLAQRVRPGGMLAFAAWRFLEYERFRSRIVPWPDDLQVEAHDYLLDWRRDVHALRYCHYVDDTEHAALVSAAGLHEIATYRADGHTGDSNQYSLLLRDVL